MRTSRGDGSSCFDVVGVLLGALSCRDPAVERLVAPVGCRELVEVGGGQLVRHDVCSELVPAEDVIPVGVGEDDVGRLGHASGGERDEKLAGVRRRRARVQPNRGALALDGAERRTVGRRRRQPVHVLADLLHVVSLSRGRCGPKRVCAEETASGLRDHEHDGHDGKRDAADGEHPDGAEPQRYVATGSQRTLQLALALCADD